MKKEEKNNGKLFNIELNIKVDEKLTQLQGRILAPRKLEKANESLKRIKSLPK